MMPAPKNSDIDSRTASTSFEDALIELQDIVNRLEEGTTSLEESMQQFERGVTLLKSCYQVLEGAEQRIELLTGVDRDGQPETEPFDASATFDAEAETEAVVPRPRKTKAPRIGELPF